MEFFNNSPLECQELKLMRWVVLFRNFQTSAGIGHYSFLANLFLVKNSSKSVRRCVSVELKWEAVVGVRQYRRVGETTDDIVEGVLLRFSPCKWRSRFRLLFPGLWTRWVPNQQIIEWFGDGSVPLDEAAVIARKSRNLRTSLVH